LELPLCEWPKFLSYPYFSSMGLGDRVNSDVRDHLLNRIRSHASRTSENAMYYPAVGVGPILGSNMENAADARVIELSIGVG
jgi:hypothetical protein